MNEVLVTLGAQAHASARYSDSAVEVPANSSPALASAVIARAPRSLRRVKGSVFMRVNAMRVKVMRGR